MRLISPRSDRRKLELPPPPKKKKEVHQPTPPCFSGDTQTHIHMHDDATGQHFITALLLPTTTNLHSINQWPWASRPLSSFGQTDQTVGQVTFGSLLARPVLLFCCLIKGPASGFSFPLARLSSIWARAIQHSR